MCPCQARADASGTLADIRSWFEGQRIGYLEERYPKNVILSLERITSPVLRGEISSVHRRISSAWRVTPVFRKTCSGDAQIGCGLGQPAPDKQAGEHASFRLRQAKAAFSGMGKVDNKFT
jgi:hypothetical protein